MCWTSCYPSRGMRKSVLFPTRPHGATSSSRGFRTSSASSIPTSI
ncbi:unnamed protein product [Linum tenue]|uniref:Uncharacterized protein n=1 Tax=Linum tenue TaxID=586396 RepID=A0AAV0IVG2_9ROSI|nr:unnamed protein product [Linum tenue]